MTETTAEIEKSGSAKNLANGAAVLLRMMQATLERILQTDRNQRKYISYKEMADSKKWNPPRIALMRKSSS